MSPQELKQQKLKAIYRGLLTLLQNRSLSDITISELCREAEVSRTYYYRNFSSFQEIIARYQEQSIISYLRLVPHATSIEFSKLMTVYFQLMGTHATETLLLINAGLTDVLISTFRRVYLFLIHHGYIVLSNTQRGKNKFFASFIAGAVISTEVEWLKSGMKESPAQMGVILKKMFDFSDATIKN